MHSSFFPCLSRRVFAEPSPHSDATNTLKTKKPRLPLTAPALQGGLWLLALRLSRSSVELAGLFAFFVEADDGFYGVAAAFEFAFGYPAVDFGNRFFRVAGVELEPSILTVNSTVYMAIKLFPNKPLKRCSLRLMVVFVF